MNISIPVRKNESYEMNVDRLGINGEGVGRIKHFTVFVEGALAGETVEIRIIKVTKNYAIGKLVRIIQPSTTRIQPFCPTYNWCGGCQLQHLDYSAQLDYKTQLVKDSLERIGKLDSVSVLPTIGMEHPMNYRNKAQFPIGLVQGEVTVGFYAQRSHEIIAIHQCGIQQESNAAVLEAVKTYIALHSIPVYQEEHHTGLLRHVVIRTSMASGEMMVILVTNGRKLKDSKEFIEILTTLVPKVISVFQNINMNKTNVILGEENIHLWGKTYITDIIGELCFKISPLSFFQVNLIQTKKLYDKVLEYANLSGDEIVFDAYCGIGTISLFLARKAKKVYGIEIVEQAVLDARENAKFNDIQNVEFITGESEIVIPQLIHKGIIPDVIVVDPPRKGCDERLLKAIVDVAPNRIIYVSCNPSTLARDLAILTASDYNVHEVQPVDMFPQTTHVETVTLLYYK